MSVVSGASGDRETRLQAGILLARNGDLEEAVAVFNALLKENSRDADVMNNLAVVYRRQGKDQDALGALLDAIDIDPTKAEFQYNLGKVYKQLGNFKSASMAYAKAVESAPDLIPSYINLGAAYFRLNEFGKALYAFKSGLKADPSNLLMQSGLEAVEAARSGGTTDNEIEELGDLFMGAPPDAVETVPVVSEPAEAFPAAEASPPEAPSVAPELSAEPELSVPAIAPLLGLMQYLRKMVAFMPPQASRLFAESGTEENIEYIIETLSVMEQELLAKSWAEQGTREPAPGAPPPAEAESPAGEEPPSGEETGAPARHTGKGGTASRSFDDPSDPGWGSNPETLQGLTGMLSYLSDLAMTLPKTEMRDKVTQQVESIIKEIQDPSADEGSDYG
ncbi:MAG: tetratricopeptide repeat protein [Treponema sp.]|jgi:tetratricopeptide (TPR) repeat protein|nr:tetratricopeptide repeat protein [Treponema sp.]